MRKVGCKPGTRKEAMPITSRESSWIETLRITGSKFLVISGIWWHHRISQQTQSSRARTDGEMWSRYVTGKKWKAKRSQFIIKLDAMAVAMGQPMVVGTVSRMAAANECTR